MPSYVRSSAAFAANSQTASSQNRSSITALADGGFLVVWQTMDNSADGSWWAIKSQRFNAQGVAVGSETLVNNLGAGDQTGAKVTSLASGGYVVTWETSDTVQDGSGTAIKARLFDSAGVALGGEFRVNSLMSQDQKEPVVTSLADGGFVVAWYTTDIAQDGAGWAIKAQRFSAAGAAVGSEFRVNTTAFGSQYNIDIASVSSGGFVVTWQTGNSSGTQVSAQVYGADGVKLGSEITVSNGFSSHTYGRVAGLANGGFVVTWTTDIGGGLGICAQIFNAAGVKVGATLFVNSGTFGVNPDVAALADGTFLITWEGRDGGIKAQSYSAAGQKLGTEYNVADAADAFEAGVAVTALANGNLVVGWTHNVVGSSSGDDIRLQILRPNTAPELGADNRALSVAENNQNVATITATDADGPSAIIYSIAGGTDAARFTINASTGLLRFVSNPNFETPADVGGDNVYQVIVRASDGDMTDLQTISVTVTNVNEAPTITSNGGGATAAIALAEGSVAVTNVAALDDSPVTYSISGGTDAGRFLINSATGALSFAANPDFEQPDDADGNNVYLVTVRASDGTLSDTQALSITVFNANERPVIISNGGGASAFVEVDEGLNYVATVTANDPDGAGAVTYSITGGAHAGLFAIDAATGVLSFAAAPDYEAPLGGSGNIYSVIVTASDGELSSFQSVQVSVRDVNEGVVITSAANMIAYENLTEAGMVAATDLDGDSVSFAIAGGADGALFEIDAATGHLSFLAAPDFEAPADSDGDNVYEVSVSASDGILSDVRTVTVAVGNVDEPIEIFSYGGAGTVTLAMDEGGFTVGRVEAADPDGASIAYAIAGGADAGLFAIDSSTGELTFAFEAGPDFEAPADSDGDNFYEVTVAATAGGSTATQSFAVSVTNLNEGVVITSGGGSESFAVTVAENGTAVTAVAAADVDGDAIVYSIAGGADSSRFAIDSQTGALSFVQAADFEVPADADGDNVYEVVVSVTDGTFSDSQAVAVTVANLAEIVTIGSNGGGDTASVEVAENGTAVATVAASSSDGGGAVTYAIAGGADAARFTIEASTGVLAFVAASNFEAPTDAGGNNVYEVVVSASNGATTDLQALAVTVGNVNEPMAITSNGGGAGAVIAVSENSSAVTTVVGTDVDGDPIHYVIVGGADSGRFTLDGTQGELTFRAAPDFEAPSDSDADNVYDLVVWASDGHYTDTQTLTITVANVLEPVVITSNGGGAGASIAIAENGNAVATVAAINPDGGILTYAIAGGADAARFTIDTGTGVLAFVTAPDFEAPADTGANNVYDVIVSASNGSSIDTQTLAVTVANVNEALAITSNGGGAGAAVAVTENSTAVATVLGVDPDGGPVTYVILDGGDSGLFTISPTTGVLAFRVAPNFEAPGDLDGDNVYELVVSASDGSFVDTQVIAVTVGNFNEAPVITSNGGGAGGTVSVVENGVTVAVVAATDPEGTTATYSIVGGADAARFTINAQTGVLQFVTAPDWELPADSNGDNVYALVVRASDGQLVDDQALTVTVTNIRDGNNVTGTASGDSISATSTNLALRTSNEEDLVFGRDGHDTIQGMAGDDELNGEGGNDVLVGGAGADKLLGGLGKDQFTYNAVAESTVALRDLIMDFNRAQGDKISLSAIDSSTALTGNQAFTFIGTSAFSNVAGQLRYETSGGMTIVSGDVNGDGIADLQIQLSGSIALIASDFVL